MKVSSLVALFGWGFWVPFWITVIIFSWLHHPFLYPVIALSVDTFILQYYFIEHDKEIHFQTNVVQEK